jgi:hypothetical protein
MGEKKNKEKLGPKEEKAREFVVFKNEMFEAFSSDSQMGVPVLKLDALLTSFESYKLTLFCKKVEGSAEYQAYMKKRKDLIEEYRKTKKEEFEEEVKKIQADDKEKTAIVEQKMKNLIIGPDQLPEWKSLIESETKFSLEKIAIDGSKIADLQERRNNLKKDDYRILLQFFDFENMPT